MLAERKPYAREETPPQNVRAPEPFRPSPAAELRDAHAQRALFRARRVAAARGQAEAVAQLAVPAEEEAEAISPEAWREAWCLGAEQAFAAAAQATRPARSQARPRPRSGNRGHLRALPGGAQ